MKIILHIGNGKTGTTSIQDSLAVSSDTLAKSGIRYLGSMLEEAPVHVARWQRRGVHPNATILELTKADQGVVRDQIFDALSANIEALEADAVHTLIWSNERFFHFPLMFEEPLKRLLEQGHQVQVIAYVRRHDSWARSAHNQWYIKHKRNKGANLPFSTFARQYKVAYAPALRGWDAALGEHLLLRNFDAISNVVDDFCQVAGLPAGTVLASRSNETPSPEETMLRAVLNDRIGAWEPEAVDSAAFERLLQPALIDFTADPVDLVNDLLPSDDDLKFVVDASAGDRAEVDQLLVSRGVPPIETTAQPTQRLEVNGRLVDSALFQMLVNQARQIEVMQQEIAQLRERVDRSSAMG